MSGECLYASFGYYGNFFALSLAYIATFRPQANPARFLLQQLNRFLMKDRAEVELEKKQMGR